MTAVQTKEQTIEKNINKVQRYGWIFHDRPGRFMTISKERLAIDDTYQRSAKTQKLLRIASAWSWIACGAIIVGHRNGTFYVMDGQHRVLAARKRSDITQLPCMVFETDGPVNEAKGFLITNTERIPVRSVEKFKALVMTEHPPAMHVDRLLKEAGRTMSDNAGPGVTGCLTLLLNAATSMPKTLDGIWPLIVAVCEGHSMHTRMVSGLLYIEHRLPDGESLNNARWRKRILQVGYDNIMSSIHKAAAFYEYGGGKVFAQGILEAVNRGLHSKLTLDI